MLTIGSLNGNEEHLTLLNELDVNDRYFLHKYSSLKLALAKGQNTAESFLKELDSDRKALATQEIKKAVLLSLESKTARMDLVVSIFNLHQALQAERQKNRHLQRENHNLTDQLNRKGELLSLCAELVTPHQPIIQAA